MNRTYRVRLGLIAVASLFALLVVIQPGHSQPFPSGPGGGFRGAPGTTAPPGMPGPPGGIGGGFRGGPPGMPAPPIIPPPPAPPPISPPPRMGIGGAIGGGGPPVYTWSCGRCGRVLGTGPVPPATAYCPFCQVNNTIPGGSGPPVGGPLVPAGMNPPAEHGGGVYVAPSSSPSSGAPVSQARVATVVAVSLGVLLLLVVGIMGVVIAVMKNQSDRPRRRRRRYDD
jgi:hypothetical protein